ncbi:MAG: hypothetical protein AB7V57_21085, partial [Verrucomicrobiales bacterium]
MSTSKKATRRRKSEKVPGPALRVKQVRPAQEKPEERDFTGGGIFCLPARQGTTGDPVMDEAVVRLVVDWDCGQYEPYLVEMIITVLKLGREDLGSADLKLFSRALREMRASSKLFRHSTHRPKIAFLGSART